MGTMDTLVAGITPLSTKNKKMKASECYQSWTAVSALLGLVSTDGIANTQAQGSHKKSK